VTDNADEDENRPLQLPPKREQKEAIKAPEQDPIQEEAP